MAQTLLQETFRGPTTPAAVVTLNTAAPGFPCLTANPAGAPAGSTIPSCGLSSPDAVGQGALRFTAVTEQQASGFVAATSLPTAQGLSISFTQYQYGGHGLDGPGSDGGGDGIAFFMAVAPPHPQVLGPQGGALGYASAGSAEGLPGGWLGIGLDAFGNYSNAAFGHQSCPVPAWAGFNADSVTVRGPGHGTAGYCLIASSADDVFSALMATDAAAAVPLALRGEDRASSARRIHVQVTPSDGLFRVFVDSGSGPVLATSGALPTSYYDPETGGLITGLPPRITFGFAASTGTATDIHEIADLTATTVTGGVPILGLTKTTTLSSPPAPGEGFGYVLTPRVDGAVAETAPLSLRVGDTLPAGVTLSATPGGPSWSCALTAAAAFDCAYTGAAAIPAGTVLPAISVPVVLGGSVAPGTAITNTASVLSDDAATPVNASVTIIVASPPPPLTITTTTLPVATSGSPYTTTLAATGGSGGRTWSVSAGALPTGVTLATNGILAGTPTAGGPFTFTARVADSAGASDTQALTLTVNAAVPPLTITTTAVASATVGVAYSATLAATGGSGARTWTVSAGALPGGVTLSAAGAVTGTPTAAGTFPFTARVADTSGGVDTQTLSLQVAAAPIAVTTTSLPGATVGVGYTATLVATGGTGARTWTRTTGTLPGGVTLSAAGVIAGTPTAAGTFAFTVRVTDAAGAAVTRALSIAVAPATQPLAITTTSPLPAAEVGVRYTLALWATGGTLPYRWTIQADALPAGLMLSLAGVIDGVPTMPGGVAFTVRVTDAQNRFVQRRFWLPVRLPIAIVTAVLPDGRAGSVYRMVLQRSGGLAPLTWTLATGTLPTGLTLTANGVLSGTPSNPGVFTFSIRLADALGGVASRQFTVAITRPTKAYLAVTSDGCLRTHCDATIRVVNLDTGVQTSTIALGEVYRGGPVVLASPDGQRTYALTETLGEPGVRLHVVDTNTDRIVRTVNVDIATLMVFSPDGATLYYVKALPTPGFGLVALNTSTFEESYLATLPRHIEQLVASPDGERIYALGSGRLFVSHTGQRHDNAEVLTYARTGALLGQLTLGDFKVRSGVVTPNGGRLLVSASRYGANDERLFDISTSSNAVADEMASPGGLFELVAPTNGQLWGLDPLRRMVADYSLVTNTLTRRIGAQVAFVEPDTARPGAYVGMGGPGNVARFGRLDAAGGGIRALATIAMGSDRWASFAVARASH